MQDALPFIVALVLFVGAVLYLARKKPAPKARNPYRRWNAQHPPPRTSRPSRGPSRSGASGRPRST